MSSEIMPRQPQTGTEIALAQQRIKGEVDMQVSTAKAYPRDLVELTKRAEAMIIQNEETAKACIYSLPRKDKQGKNKPIEGPSVRLAEIVATCWGNLRCESKIVGEDDRFITAESTTWDMENNVLIRLEVRRGITGKYGRFSNDMIGVTGNAAVSIAYRNSVMKVVPRALIDQLYNKAKQFATGDAKALPVRINNAVQSFAKMGIYEEQLLGYLGKQSIADLDAQDLTNMIGTFNRIKDDQAHIDDVFPPDGSTPKRQQNGNGKPPRQSRTSELKEQLANNGKPKTNGKPKPKADRAPHDDVQMLLDVAMEKNLPSTFTALPPVLRDEYGMNINVKSLEDLTTKQVQEAIDLIKRAK